MLGLLVTLSGEDFRKLVNGQSVTKENEGRVINIALADIGFGVMRSAIIDADTDKETPVEDLSDRNP